MFLYIDESRCDLLPLHAITVGTDYAQERVDRPNGFYAHHIYCVEQGRCVFQTPEKRVTLEAGTVLLIRKNYPTSYYSACCGLKVGFVTFDGSAVDRLLEYYRAENFMYLKNDALVASIGQCARLGARNGSPAQLSCALYEILEHFFAERYHDQAAPSLIRAKKYIERRCCDPALSVIEIARETGVSTSLLFESFRKEEHTTPMEYVRRMRIFRAKQILLEYPNLRVAEVAARCGFSDCAYFCKVFKAATGMTPRTFVAVHA